MALINPKKRAKVLDAINKGDGTVLKKKRPSAKPLVEEPPAQLLEKKLFEAVVEKDAQKVNNLLQEGADVNAKDDNNDTPLMRASYHGHKEIVELLIQYGADVKAENKEGRTALKFVMHTDFDINLDRILIDDLLRKHGAIR